MIQTALSQPAEPARGFFRNGSPPGVTGHWCVPAGTGPFLAFSRADGERRCYGFILFHFPRRRPRSSNAASLPLRSGLRVYVHLECVDISHVCLLDRPPYVSIFFLDRLAAASNIMQIVLRSENYSVLEGKLKSQLRSG